MLCAFITTLLVATSCNYLAMTTPPYPDLIEMQDGLNRVIAPPLKHSAEHCYPAYQGGQCLDIDEIQTVIEAEWNREADALRWDRERYEVCVERRAESGNGANCEGWLPRFITPEPHQKMALFHLLTEQGPLRAGDFTVLHGQNLSALQENTFVLEKDWQHLMDCVATKGKPECVGY